MWQRRARQGIGLFVVVFAVVVAVALRQRRPPRAADPLPERKDPVATVEAGRGVNYRYTKEGKVVYSIKCDNYLAYPDGRTRCVGADVTLPDRNGRSISVVSREAEVTSKPDQAIGTARFTGNVRVKTSDGIEITTGEATYDDATGVLTAPGQVAFSRGRMKGTGGSATYDRNRDVLWLNQQPVITVSPDAIGGGAMEAHATAAGLARADHYVRFTGEAWISADGRTIQADDITVQLSPDDQRVATVQLRGNSRVTGAPGGTAPQAMTARDIDLTYGEDGRSLQHVQLMENAVVQLPAGEVRVGRRIAGRTVAIGMSPDGATVTSLSATGNVQVDLPAEGDAAAKRIRAAALVASGRSGAGLQEATFTGKVEYREVRAERRTLPAVDRTARALKLIIQTQPGFGSLQQADFRGNVHFTDGTELSADAPRGLYQLDRDRLNLSPGEGDPGPQPHVTDGRVSVDARTIDLTIATRKLRADARVRSSVRPDDKSAAGTPADATRVPSMLEQDKPVNVTSDHLEYDGAAARALYTGAARLWQGDTTIQADSLVLDDRTGNLEAHGSVRTEMPLAETDAQTGERRVTRSIGTSKDFLYDDANRLATYETAAHLVGSQGDVTADRLELFLKPGANELERAEGYDKVVVKEGTRTATGERLTYMAATEEYFMTGRPVVVVQNTPPSCRKTTAGSLTFQKSVDKITSRGAGPFPQKTEAIACPAERQ